jgi:membrane associated rhomboid family serine protease
MIPLDDIDRKPLHAPMITGVIIAVNVFVFVLEALYGAPFVIRWSYIPAQIVAGKDLITLLTAMFIHGGLLHIVGNMLFFWAFAPEIEDAMGRARFAVFYLLGGLVASLAQIIMIPYSNVPNLGASGAIAAVMGAFLISFPYDRIRTVVFLGFFVTITLVPSILLVGLWFLLQLFSGVGSLTLRQGAGIAYMAHVGGFIFGMLTGRLFMYPKPAGR